MKCENKDGCHVFKKHGDLLCKRLYCNDKCPTDFKRKSTITDEEFLRSQKH